MSYSVRDDNATLGQGAAIEFNNGAGPTFQGKVQAIEFIGIYGGNATNLVTGTKYCVFLAPPNPSTASLTLNLGGSYQVVGGSIVANTASTSGTLAIEVCAAGTADGSGTNVLSTATTSLAAGGTGMATATPAPLTLATNVDNLTVAPNARVNFILGGTLTGLVNLNATLYIARVS
jgi:hypothetical protein